MNTNFTDPVCGMQINSDNISLDYQGTHYVFCSDQCLQRFQDNPHLYIGYPGHEAPKHAGVEVIKTRKLKLSEPLPQELADRLTGHIETMMGIQHVEVSHNSVEVTYDLLQATEAQIETVIAEAGAALGGDWLEKIRRGLVHYMEDTEAVSLEARPGSMRGHQH